MDKIKYSIHKHTMNDNLIKILVIIDFHNIINITFYSI